MAFLRRVLLYLKRWSAVYFRWHFTHCLLVTLANIEDPDEMPHYAAFHQNPHRVLRYKMISTEKKTTIFFLEIISCDPLIYAVDHPSFIMSNQKEDSVSA